MLFSNRFHRQEMVPFYAYIEKHKYKNIICTRIGTKELELVPKVIKNEKEKIFI